MPADRDARVDRRRLVAAQRRRHRRRRASRPSSAAFAGVARGRRAGEAARVGRSSPSSTATCPRPARCSIPCAPGNAFSVTELEEAAGVSVPLLPEARPRPAAVDERERDKDVWLDPLTRGSELHDLYAVAAAPLPRRRPPARHEEGRRVADGRSRRQRLTELQREMPAATAEILERESKDFLADVELFLEAECEPTRRRRRSASRCRSGVRSEDDDEPLARAEPVEIDLGGGLTFRIAGRIDRIDKVGPASFEVLDYKTGGFWRDDWKGTFNGGRRLQHALYGLAAVELLRAHATRTRRSPRGVYYFSSHKGRQERVQIPAPPQRGDRRRAGRPARGDRQGRVRPRAGRGRLQVLRLRRRVRRATCTRRPRPSWRTRS